VKSVPASNASRAARINSSGGRRCSSPMAGEG
jgi:hypothetical protein